METVAVAWRSKTPTGPWTREWLKVPGVRRIERIRQESLPDPRGSYTYWQVEVSEDGRTVLYTRTAEGLDRAKQLAEEHAPGAVMEPCRCANVPGSHYGVPGRPCPPIACPH